MCEAKLARRLVGPIQSALQTRGFSSTEDSREELLTQFQGAKTAEVRARIFDELRKKETSQAEVVLLMYTAQAKGECELVLKIYSDAVSDTSSGKGLKPNLFMLNTVCATPTKPLPKLEPEPNHPSLTPGY